MKQIIAGNWKMNLTVAESVRLASCLVEQLSAAQQAGEFDPQTVDVVVAPTNVALHAVAQALIGSPISVSGQDCHFEAKGAFTGENSPSHLRAAGAQYCLVGHSERRQFFGESDEGVAKKTGALLSEGLTPIVCVGETLDEREAGNTLAVVGRQLNAVLSFIEADDVAKIVVAYEPVWAIGTGKTATPEQAQEVHAAIRELISRHSGPNVGNRVRIQYGGSVKPENANSLLGQPDINGALVGGASLTAQSFAGIVKAT